MAHKPPDDDPMVVVLILLGLVLAGVISALLYLWVMVGTHPGSYLPPGVPI